MTFSRRRRVPLCYLGLAALAYIPPLFTARGRVAADTKQYLYLDPGRLLSRATSMWDPHVAMGTVTHQTIGYVFPMGPYYWLLDKVGLPDWVAQRLWLGSLLFFAAIGVLYLARTFGWHGSGVIIAAIAYMCTPYVLDYAARISVLLMPWAALPWMIGPIRKALRDGGWRYPAIFALVVQVVGGVNATALIFVGVGPVLWILYEWLIARTVRFVRAWDVTARTFALTFVTSLWWIAGLRMQGAYGLNVLKYSETVDVVAKTSTPNEVLRGLGYWFFYGQDRLGPWIEAARDYTQRPVVILAGYGLVVLGLLAIAFVRWRHRVFLGLLLLVGVVIAVGAHPYDTPTPLGALFKAFATGSTAGLALRSTGRAVPLVVLSLAMFLGLGTNAVAQRLGRRNARLAMAVPVVVGALVLANFPALVDGTYYGKNLQRPENVPSYWTRAIAALGSDPMTRILEEPGADFASYRWGNTVDPITPGLTDRPYVARELIPFGTAGTADLLNAMDRRLQEGVADPRGLVAIWRRMGVGAVLARNDIQYERYDLVSPTDLARVLATTPGLTPPTAYGPSSSFAIARHDTELTLSDPLQPAQVPSVAVYGIEDPTPIVRSEGVDHELMISGDGESLVDAADVGLLDQAGVVRYSASSTTAAALRSATGDDAVLVITDGNRLRARRWTTVRDNLGYTEQAGEVDRPLRTDLGDARLDVFPGEQASAQSTMRVSGARLVTATSYGNIITYTPEDRAAMAFDGDPQTAWRAAAFGKAVGERIRLVLDAPITADHLRLLQPVNGGRDRYITQVAITFDGGSRVVRDLDPSTSRTVPGQTISFPKRTFTQLEIEVTAVNEKRPNLFGQSDAVGFAEIAVRDEHANRDVRVHETIAMPTDLLDALGADVAQHPLVLLMRRESVQPVPPRTQPELAIDRTFVLPQARAFGLTGSATISSDAPASTLEGALGIPAPGMTASAYLPGCVECGPASALDGDTTTAWQTPFKDVVGQWFALDLGDRRSFDHLDLQIVADGRHSVPTHLALDVDGVRRNFALPPIKDQSALNATVHVRVRFPRVSGRSVKVTVLGVREERAQRFATSATVLEPVGIAELGIPRFQLPAAPRRVDSGCNRRLLAIDGRPVPVRISGAAPAAANPFGLTVALCDPHDPKRVPLVSLAPGAHTLTTAEGKQLGWSIDRLVLASGTDAARVDLASGRVTSAGAPVGPTPHITVTRNGETTVRVHVTGAQAPFWLVLGQSQSAGWRAHIVGGASLGGSQLVDGYANGWQITPTHDAFDVVMEWRPQRQVALALWISLLAGLGCLALVVLTWPRRLKGAVTNDNAVALELRGRRLMTTTARWIAVGAVTVLSAVVVTPWVGVLVGAATYATLRWPRLRAPIMVVPAALLAGCALYIVVQQQRYHYPSVFEWPTLFPRARTPAWIAIMLVSADIVVEIVARLTNMREKTAPEAEKSRMFEGEEARE
ncbi:MAG TPA: alpha-(1-_3)-arabinofuranosyltransferase family protein [Acidimicrobiia bacterium]|nr:alpha-(1->3)-arabinofuranosyltransferase family protein [Acidimicrobiia bacterium]